MTLIVLGLALWIGAHFFKRLAPDARAAMGDKGKGIMALIMAAGLVLMIIGYRSSGHVDVWYPPSWGTHLNNLLMVVAVVLFGMAKTSGRLRGRMRHPMLTGVAVWAVAHLLVNGDLASVILFGGMLGWTVVQARLINRAEPVWDRPAPGEAKGDVKLAVISLVVFCVMVGVHYALGYPTFG